MSNLSTDPARQLRLLRRWHRFIDRLAGAPNLERLEKLKNKPWFIRYSETLALLLLSFAVFIAPELANQYNGIPTPTSLQTLQVKILRTHKKEPHLYVELPDGTRRGMEWPVLIRARGGFPSYVWTDEQRELLPGCNATVQGTPVSWTFNDRFRVWALNCPQRGITISLDRTSEQHLKDGGLSPVLVAGTCLCYLFILVIFLRERRGNK
jgi:hypothetical protein